MELTPRSVSEADLEESPDALDPDEAAAPGGGPNLAPRSRSLAGRSRRRWLPLAVVALVVVVGGALVLKGLNEATLYFLNADEAVAQREDLGDRRFRLQGTVVADAVAIDDGVTFEVAYNDVAVEVHHTGTPPDLFEPGVPVVLEGRWDPSGEFFSSDEMLVKHDAEYESQEDYEERMDEAEDGQDGATTP